MASSRSRDGGFTLVELAVVVVILGVLAAFAVPRFFASIERCHTRQGTDAFDLGALDIEFPPLEDSTRGPVEVPGTESSLQTASS